MIRHWFNELKTSSQTTRQSRARRRRQLCVLDALEERVLLSGSPTVFTVNTTSNNAAVAGSLPFEIKKADANTNLAGSVIEFDKNVFKAGTSHTITLKSTLALTETKGPEVIDGPGASIVTISGNNAVEVFSVATGVTASLSGLTITGGSANTHENGGGGIGNDGTLTVANSTIESNSVAGSASGGGILNLGTLTITNSTIENNSAGGEGGGIFNDGTVTVIQSTIAGNSALDGSGIYTLGGTLTVIGSTIANNVQAEFGGGIQIAGGTALLVNSTIADNSATLGGGIENDGSLLAVNCTIAYNSVSSSGAGGGLYDASVYTTTLRNTIVADNTMPVKFSLHPGLPGVTLEFTSDIVLAAGATDVSASYDLIGGSGLAVTGGYGGLTDGTDGNLVGVNPLLGSLARNGGPTQTMALLAGSPAIDAGNVALAFYNVVEYETVNLNGHPTTITLVHRVDLTTDQRGAGFPRTHLLGIHGTTVDIGAFEVQPA